MLFQSLPWFGKFSKEAGEDDRILWCGALLRTGLIKEKGVYMITIGSFKVTINWSIIVFIICFLIFLMVNNNGMINGQYSIKDRQGLLLR